jgi:hypothetical protein
MKTQTEPIRLAIPEQTQLSEDISPFDIPKSIIACCNPELEMIEIQFCYISNESTMILDLPSDSRVVLGKNSHRIYALSIPCTNLTDFSHIQHLFLKAIVDTTARLMSHVSQKDIPESNFNIIKRLISDNSKALEDYTIESMLPVYA